jgi:propionyl-CoA carboxylase beta chain
VNILYRRELAASKSAAALRKRKVDEFREKFANPYVAAERGFVDEVSEPRRTRGKVIRALRLLKSKKDVMPPRKHGNIPL